MITQTVKVTAENFTVNMKGVDFRDMRVQRKDDGSLELNLTEQGFMLMKEAFANGEASVSSSGKKVSAKVEKDSKKVPTKEKAEKGEKKVAVEKDKASSKSNTGTAGTGKGKK